ncbi:MAG: response regulator, partial [Pseudomonadales bacterium]
AAAQRIVQMHGGAIKAESHLGQGSTFRLLLRPLVTQAAPAVPTSSAASFRAMSILVVDDDAEVRAVAERMLVEVGAVVWAFASGAEALAHFELHADETDLVLLDVLMPELDGKEVFEKLRQLSPRTPVVFMSGFDRAKLDGINEDSVEFLQKPFSLDALTSVISRGLRTSVKT